MAFTTLPLEKCKLNPVGRCSVTSHFAKSVDNSFASKLDSASLAFLVSGSHADRKHGVQRNHFHEDYRIGRAGCTSRENYNLRMDIFRLICDAACSLDRMSGGCTIAISLAGGLRPGSLVTPENIRAEVYVPPHLIEERPHFKPVFATLVQSFIEKIGVEVSERWLRGAEASNMGIQNGENITGPGTLPVFPPPFHGSCHFTFWGHAAGELEGLIAAEEHGMGGRGRPEAEGPNLEVMRLTEEVRRLEEEVSRLREVTEKQRAEIDTMHAAEKKRMEEVCFMFNPKPPSASMSQAPTPRAATPSPQGGVPASVGSSPAVDRAGLKASSTPAHAHGKGKAKMATPDITRTPPVTPSSSPQKASRSVQPHVGTDRCGSTTPSSKVSHASATRRSEIPGYARPLGSAFPTPVKRGSTPLRQLSSPIPIDSDSETESSVTPSSRHSPSPVPRPAAQPSFLHIPPATVNAPLRGRSPVVPGFSTHSARYLRLIGQTKYASKAVELVYKECPSSIWPEEFVRLLDITWEQAVDLSYMVMTDCDEQGLLPVE